MLVLSRKKSEAIVIQGLGGERLELTVLEITRKRVRFGLTAPQEISILRSEVAQATARNGETSKRKAHARL